MGSLDHKYRHMCHVVDELAERNPDQLFCVHPTSDGKTQEWRRITFKDLAAAVSYTAWWIDETLGQGSKSEPLAYMGVNDIRYVVFLLACIKTGYAVSNRKYHQSRNLTVLIWYAGVATLTEKF